MRRRAGQVHVRLTSAGHLPPLVLRADFGEVRLRRALSECAGMPAEAVTERVQMLATEWAGASRGAYVDDMAALAITAPRTAYLSAVDGHTRGRYTA